jgi:hypothetical protein
MRSRGSNARNDVGGEFDFVERYSVRDFEWRSPCDRKAIDSLPLEQRLFKQLLNKSIMPK